MHGDHDQACVGRGSAAERCGWSGVGLHFTAAILRSDDNASRCIEWRAREHPGADDRYFDRVLVIFPLDTPVARREPIFAKTFAGSGMLSAITPASGTALSTAAHIASAAAAVPAPVSAPPASPECLAAP